MFGVQHTCNPSLAYQNKLCFHMSVDAFSRPARATVAGSRLTLQSSRTLHVHCSTHSNSFVSMRTAATTHAQLACEPSTVQDLLAHVVHSSTHQQQHQQRTLQQAIDLQRQPQNGHFIGVEDDLPSGLGSADAPAVQEAQQPQHQGDQQWRVFDQYQRQVFSLDHQVVQQMQLHAKHDAVEPHFAVQDAAAGAHVSGTGELHDHQHQHQQQHHHHRHHQHQQHLQQLDPQQQLDAVAQQADLLLQASTDLLVELQAAAGQQRSGTGSRHAPPLPRWSQQEAVRGWRYSQQDKVARTAAGLAVLRLSSAAKPTKQAKQLLSWLRREQKVVLSAAGAALAYTALQCIAQVQLMLQQHPQYQLLVTADFKSSRRPQGWGRCEVYNLTCSLQHVQDSIQAGLDDDQQYSNELPRGLQPLHREVTGRQHTARAGSDVAPDGQLLQHWQVACEPGGQTRQQCQHTASSYPVNGLRGKPGGTSEGPSGIAVEHQMQWLGYGHNSAAAAAVFPLHLSSNTLHYQQLQQQHGVQQMWSCLPQMHQPPMQQQALQYPQRQQPQRHRRRKQQQQQQQQQQADHPLAAVQQTEVRGTSVSIADMLDLSLQQRVGVMLAVPYAKQAVKVLEAAAIVSRRWQQRGAKTDCSVVVALQAWPGAVKRGSSSKQGLHVLIIVAPLVQ